MPKLDSPLRAEITPEAVTLTGPHLGQLALADLFRGSELQSVTLQFLLPTGGRMSVTLTPTTLSDTGYGWKFAGS